MQLGLLPCYYGVDGEVHWFSLFGFLEALFPRTDVDLQVIMAAYSSDHSVVVLRGASIRPQTHQQQHTIHQFLPRDTLLSSPGAMSIPVGLSSKELAQLRSNALRSGPANPLPPPSPAVSAVSTDGDVLGGMTTEVPPLPEVRRLQSEVDHLRREVERLDAERSEPPPTYISRGAA